MMHYETLPNGKRAQVRDGYTMRNGYFERDGHGGHGIEHRKEMASIALQIMQDNLPRMIESICLDIWNSALNRLIGAIEYDINTVVQIAINDANEIFTGKQVSKFISNAIMKNLVSEIDKIRDIKIKL